MTLQIVLSVTAGVNFKSLFILSKGCLKSSQHEESTWVVLFPLVMRYPFPPPSPPPSLAPSPPVKKKIQCQTLKFMLKLAFFFNLGYSFLRFSRIPCCYTFFMSYASFEGHYFWEI